MLERKNQCLENFKNECSDKPRTKKGEFTEITININRKSERVALESAISRN